MRGLWEPGPPQSINDILCVPPLTPHSAWVGIQKHIPLIERILEWNICPLPKLGPDPQNPAERRAVAGCFLVPTFVFG